MENSYNKFRFKNRELIKKHGENAVHSVFEDVWFCVNLFGLGDWAIHDIIAHIHFGMKEKGMLIPDVNGIAGPVIGFIFDEAELDESEYNLYDDIYKIVSEILPARIPGAEKFVELLAGRISEEFLSGDRSLTMHDIAARLKAYPELRFLSLTLLEDVMDSVYDYLAGEGEE